MKLISLALLVMASAAHGACPVPVPSNKACVSWSPSTRWTNNVVYAPGTVVTYTIYQISPTIVTLGTTTQTFFLSNVLPAGNKCFGVTATVNDAILGTRVSIRAPSGCKVLRFAGPTDGKIEGPTDGKIEPK